MDQTLVASIRKNLESKATEELRQAFESEDKAGRSSEELEALRQLLDERRLRRGRTVFALASAMVVGSLAGAYVWWQLGAGVGMVVAGAGGAILGFASWYIPDLIPRV